MRRFVAVSLIVLLVSPIWAPRVAAQARGAQPAAGQAARPPQAAAPAAAARPPAAQTSAIKNSFQEVTSRLDQGGNLFLYMSTEEYLKNLSTQLTQLQGLFGAMGASPADLREINQVFNIVGGLIKRSGLEEISGFGMSSLAIDKDLYRTVSVLHHYKGAETGFFWGLPGKRAHALGALDMLPATTAFASFSDLDLPLLWNVINTEVNNSGIPDARQALASVAPMFAAMTGGDFNKTLASLGGEFGIAITLDEKNMMSLPIPGPPIQIPEIGLMIAIKVKDDTVFNMVDAQLTGNPMVLRVDRPDLKMRTMPLPIPLPINVRPSLARAGDYLLLASTDSLIETALSVKAGKTPGIKSTPEFKRLSQRVPDQGNSFAFFSQKVGDTIKRVQSIAMANTPGAPQGGGPEALMMSLFPIGGSYQVSGSSDEGIVSVGNGGSNPAGILVAAAAAVPLIAATVAIPSMMRSREAANESAAVANLRTLNTAEVTYLSRSGGNYGDMAALISAGLLDSSFTSVKAGYQFSITVSGRNYVATATPVSSNTGRFGYYSDASAVVRYSLDARLAPAGMSGSPVQ